MGIEDFKRWHWIAISIVVGAVLVYSRLQIQPDDGDVYRRGLSPAEFISMLQRPKTSNGYEWVSNVTIYPPVEVYNSQTKKIDRLQYVTGMNLEQTGPGKGMYKPFQFNADVPFRVGARVPANPDYSIRDYINEMKKTRPEITFSYAWWREPAAVAALWGGGTVLLVGGIWPTLINLMIGAGLGRKREPKKVEYDLDRFGKDYKRQSGPEPKPAKPAITAADRSKLEEMNLALEKDLAASGIAATANPSAATNLTAGTIRKLEDAPLEVAAVEKPPEEHDYRGEFYPVDRHINRPNDKH